MSIFENESKKQKQQPGRNGQPSNAARRRQPVGAEAGLDGALVLDGAPACRASVRVLSCGGARAWPHPLLRVRVRRGGCDARALLTGAGCWSALRLCVASVWCDVLRVSAALVCCASPLALFMCSLPARVCPTHPPHCVPPSFPSLSLSLLVLLWAPPRLRTPTTRPSCCLHSATPHTHASHKHTHS